MVGDFYIRNILVLLRCAVFFLRAAPEKKNDRSGVAMTNFTWIRIKNCSKKKVKIKEGRKKKYMFSIKAQCLFKRNVIN